MLRAALVAFALGLGTTGCVVHATAQEVTPLTCPTDGSTFAYGSCVVPEGVADMPATTFTKDSVGSPVFVWSGPCGQAVRPVGYTLTGTYVCQ